MAIRLILWTVLILLVPLCLTAQPTRIALGSEDCLRTETTGILTATVTNEPPGATLRFYFRRASDENELNDFYYVVGRAVGGGRYEAVLPRPSDDDVRATILEPPDPPAPSSPRVEELELRPLPQVEELRRPVREELVLREAVEPIELHVLGGAEEVVPPTELHLSSPVEYYVELLDAFGEVVTRSRSRLLPVGDACSVSLDDRSRGEARNIRLGETARWQREREPYLWECAGVITRIGPDGVPAVDHVCYDTFVSLFDELEEDSVTTRALAYSIQSGEDPYRTVKIFYGTDRERGAFHGATWEWDDPRDDDVPAYSGGRNDGATLELGTCEVSIPLDHTRGETETPGYFERADPEKHVLLLRVTPKSRVAFVNDIRSELAEASERSVLVFIHGYNVSFEDASRRTAQIAYDLGFPGVPVMYSWPSQGELTGYTVDEANIRWTVPHLEQFLELVAGYTGAEQIHVIAHSMGNRAFTEVLRRFAAEDTEGSAPRFNQVALVAPDVDAEVFHQEIVPAIRCDSARCVSDRVTLYASKEDKALLASKKLHGHPRAGDLSDGIQVTSGVDTVDASNVDTSLLHAISLGHSYFATIPTVIDDLAHVIAGRPPEASERAARLQRRGSGSARHWALQP